MSRMRPFAFSLTLIALVVSQVAVAQAAGPGRLSVVVPSRVAAGIAVAVELRLPSSVAAVDGRLVFDANALDFLGAAPSGGGTGLAPVSVDGGVSFGAYGLKSSGSATTLRLVVFPKVSGSIALRLAVDSVADAAGHRLVLAGATSSATLRAGTGSASYPAPRAIAALPSAGTALATRGLVGSSTLGKQDLDAIRASWEFSRLNGGACSAPREAASDANSDGCVDIVDVQAVVSGQTRPAAPNPFVQPVVAPSPQAAAPSGRAPVAAAAAFAKTFVVTSTADRADAQPGNGVCADSQDRCTLRAAITETNWSRGQDLIQFNLPGTAPVRITLGSVLPHLSDRTGGATIDGYSQPGSRVNDATYGSNAIPGVELVGTGNSPRDNIIRMQSPGNTIRGLLMNTAYRALAISGTDAHDNLVIGNWFGFTAAGTPASYNGNDGIYIDSGAANNIIGTPDLADRNVMGRSTKGMFEYGQGTNGNVIRNNVFCMTPTGATATCSTGIDHDFGPKNGIIGGFGTNERNVFGPTFLNGIEISHGWNSGHTSSALQYQSTGNQVLGNWIGFRIDGSYSASYRSAQNNPGNGDNGNAVNVYDGSSNNIVDGNWCASAYDGIVTATPNSSGNIIRNNIIGESPLGQPAPMARYGIRLRNATTDHVIQANTIRNAGIAGIGLTDDGIRRIRITRNLVFDTTGPAIFLAPDPTNPASGANAMYATPVIASATTLSVSGTGNNGATIELYRASRPAGQSGLPSVYLGSATVASGTWAISVSLNAGDVVTALQIAPNGNTSMLGTNVAATFVAPPPAPVAGFSWAQQSGNRTVGFTDTSTNSPTSWSWDFGDGGTSTAQNPTHTYTAANTYNVVLTATNAGGSNAYSTSVTVTQPPVGQYVLDAFSRLVANGWGSAPTGGAYTLTGTAANFTVDGSAASINLPSAGALRSALLNGAAAQAQDVDISFRVSVDKMPTGGAYFVYAVARRNGTNEYRPKFRLRNDGVLLVQASRVIGNVETAIGPEVVVSGLSPTAGSFIWVRAQVVGTSPTTIRVRAWADGQAEPAAWQFTATDSSAELQVVGGTGLRAYIGSNVTNAPVRFTFDDLAVVAP